MKYYVSIFLFLISVIAIAEPKSDSTPMEAVNNPSSIYDVPFIGVQAFGTYRYQTFSSQGEKFEVNGFYPEFRFIFNSDISNTPYFWNVYISSIKGSHDISRNDLAEWDYSNSSILSERNSRFSSNEWG